MIERIISFALRQRLLVIIGVAVLAAFGAYAFKKLPVDAFPDVTNIQVQVITEAPGWSPEMVEKFITYPLEVQMSGLPGLANTRSLSKFGLSVITVVFKDDVDIYFARQLALERIIEAKEKLPSGIDPAMGPVSTGLGEIYQYTLEKPGGGSLNGDELMNLRTMQDWIVRPVLKTVSGVTEINAFGGMVKQYQVIIDPDRLRKYNLTLREVFESISRNNANAGGNILEHGAEQYIIRGIGIITSLKDLGNIIVKEEHG
ncbi:MAG: efflux RND transporter permease subunit, partial [Nitrospirae bacterium]|nr:efflux RND transporter permease subunit [Nitrospirota bacterium]MDA8339487.1 efflux RND transporter permease subunit [Nitrospiraceae bacterium]